MKFLVDTTDVTELKELAATRAASLRTALKQAAMIGADVDTVPPAALRALVSHPLTDRGLEQFRRIRKRAGRGSLELRHARSASCASGTTRSNASVRHLMR
jgi:hypothetical protein